MNRGRAVHGPHYGWTIAALSALIVMGALGFGRFGYSVILPFMKEGLALGERQAADLATANLVGYLALSLTGGLLASRFGPRMVVSVSLAAAAAAMAATGLAPDARFALAARVLTGMASGGANVPVMGLLSAWFSARHRGLATGIAVSGSSLGLLVTGLALPPLLQLPGGAGWRLAWLLLAALTLLVAVPCFLLLKNRPEEVGALPVGADPATGPDDHWVAAETPRTAWADVFRHGRVWYLAFVYLLFGFSYIIYATFFVRYLTRDAGFTPAGAGALWSTIGAASIASGFLWGMVSDRLGRTHSLAIVFVLQAGAYAAIGGFRGPAAPYVSALLFALTAWSIPAIMAATAGDLLGPRLAPAALGLLTLLFGLGQAAGPFAAGRIAEASGSYAPAFLAAAGVALAGGLLSLLLRTAPVRRALP